MCLTLLTATRWSAAVWAMPVLTALCPSGRYYDGSPRGEPKKLTDFARQIIGWLGRQVASARTGLGRRCVLTADRSYCTYAFLRAAQRHDLALVTDMRLDARSFEEPPGRPPGRPGRPALAGARLPSMADLALSETMQWGNFATRAPSADGGGGRRAHAFEYTSGTALWYKPGEVPVPVQWVLVRDPAKAPGEEGHGRAARQQRLGAGGRGDHRLLPDALVVRGHLRGGAPPLGRRDAAPVV